MNRMKFDNIAVLLEKTHFFLYPSTNPTEGHSNALTEAMAFGVIPVASDAGFNRQVVGNDALIMNSLDARKYAECIANILAHGSGEGIALALRQRVERNFSQSVVSARMRAVLNELQGGSAPG